MNTICHTLSCKACCVQYYWLWTKKTSWICTLSTNKRLLFEISSTFVLFSFFLKLSIFNFSNSTLHFMYLCNYDFVVIFSVIYSMCVVYVWSMWLEPLIIILKFIIIKIYFTLMLYVLCEKYISNAWLYIFSSYFSI